MLPDAIPRWEVPIEFQHLLNKLPAGAYTCDPNGLITYYNPRAVELWGRAPKLNDPEDRFCGSFKLFSPDGSRIFHDRCWMALALHTKTEYNGREIVIERPDGRRLTVLAHANPIRDPSGRLLGAVNVLVDITDRKQAEEEQRQMQTKLAHMGRLSLAGEMAAGLAHEINQPLGSIVLYTEACLALLESNQPDINELRRAMKAVAEQGLRAGEIIHRLRRFMRKEEPQKSLIDLNELLREVVLLAEHEVRQRKVTLRLTLDEPLPQVWADSVQLQQVVLNLLQNAMEALEDSEVDRRELTLRAAPVGNEAIEMTVSDTGPGLPAEAMTRLFHPFFTTKANGMGLGLVISKAIVEAYGGRIWATTNPKQGVTFHLSLPCIPAKLSDAS